MTKFTQFHLTLPGEAAPCGPEMIRLARRDYCGHLNGGENLVIRWYVRSTMALAAMAALSVGVGAGWRWH
jgi:hypothetical protein